MIKVAGAYESPISKNHIANDRVNEKKQKGSGEVSFAINSPVTLRESNPLCFLVDSFVKTSIKSFHSVLKILKR